jgi:hypothetical protein
MELPSTTCRSSQWNSATTSAKLPELAIVSLDASSSLRRSGQRDDRRRRLLTDDLSNADESRCRVWPESASAPQKSSYGDAEFLERQWRLLDLVPLRLPIVALFLLTGIAIIAGLEAGYTWMLHRAAAGGAIVVALDLGAKGSFAGWFSSLALLAAAVASLLVYTVRRHRRDDYQGRYRVWRWAAVCWFIMATDQAASLREGFRDMMIALSGTSAVGDGTFWWVAVYVLGLGAIGSRLFLDMRPSRLSIAALLIAAVAYGLAMASSLGWLVADGGIGEVMFRVGAEMTGGLMLLAAMALHARYVLLDAEGLLPHRELEEDADDPDEGELDNEVKVVSAANRWRTVDPPQVAPQPTFQRPVTPAAAPAATVQASTSSTFTPSPLNRKLTKGERKALKDKLLRERREREGRE